MYWKLKRTEFLCNKPFCNRFLHCRRTSVEDKSNHSHPRFILGTAITASSCMWTTSVAKLKSCEHGS